MIYCCTFCVSPIVSLSGLTQKVQVVIFRKTKKAVGNNTKILKMKIRALCSKRVFHEFFTETLPNFWKKDIFKMSIFIFLKKLFEKNS
jgi:hypothetical protein